MRFQRIALKHYGHFQHLDLSFGSTPLVVLYGPNEVGKTTLLNGLRDLLYGIPMQSDYSFRFGYGEMRITADLVDGSGATWSLARGRRKGDTLSGTWRLEGQEQPVTDARLSELLGNVERKRYQAVFGITLADLQAGAKRLNDVGLDELLSGGALGGSAQRVTEVRAELEKGQDTLYKRTGRNQQINVLLNNIKTMSDEVRTKSLIMGEYLDLEREIDSTELRLATIADKLKGATVEHGRLQGLVAGWADVQAMDALNALLASAELAVALNPSQIADAQRLPSEVQTLQLKVEGLDKALLRHQGEVAENEPDSLLLSEAATVDELFSRLSGVGSARASLPDEGQQVAQLRQRVADDLEAIVPGWSLEQLAARRPDPALKTRLDRAVGEMDRVEKALNEGVGAQRTYEAARDHATIELGQLRADPDAQRIARLAERLTDASAAKQAMDAAAREVEDTGRKLTVGLARLRPALSPGVDLQTVALPRREEVERAERERTLLGDAQRAATDAHAVAERQHRDIAQDLQVVQGTRAVPSPTERDSARQARDHRWAEVQQTWLHAGALPASIPKAEALADALTQTITEADRRSDALFENADAVSKRLLQETELGRALLRVQDAKRSLDEARSNGESWERDWRSRWSGLGLDPTSPSEMLGWLSEVERLRQLAEHREERRREHDQQARRVQAWETEAAALFGCGLSWSETSREARRRQEASVRDDGKRDSLNTQLKKAESDLARTGRQLEEDHQRLAALRAEMVQTSQRLGLPPMEEPGALRDLLRDLGQVADQIRNLQGKEAGHQERKSLVRQFEEGTTALLGRLGWRVDGEQAESAVRRIAAALKEQREREAVHRRARSDLERVRGERDTLAAQLAAAEVSLHTLRRSVDVVDDEGLVEVVRRATERTGLLQERKKLDDRLVRAFGAGDGRVAAEARLRSQDLPSLQADLNGAADQQHQLQDQLGSLREQRGKLIQQKEQLGGSEAAKKRADMEVMRAGLEEGVEEYIRLAAAEAVLKRAVHRYSQEHQSSIFRLSSEILSRLTGGRHTGVRPDPEQKMLLVTSGDQERTPDQLSSGTREQLFLALRLAFIREHSERHEPLPVLLDDVMVDFDQDRTRAALEILGGQEGQQVLLLTCHPRTVELARAVLPEERVQVVTLSGDA